MKKVIFKSFPFKGYGLITIFYWIFVREDYAKYVTKFDENHETIHFWQLVGLFAAAAAAVLTSHFLLGTSLWWLLLTPATFYLLYGAWWLCLLRPAYIKALWKWYFGGRVGDAPENTAYDALPFEREAYDNETNLEYTQGWRKPLFSWVRYIRK